jgi:hypothetical protein
VPRVVPQSVHSTTSKPRRTTPSHTCNLQRQIQPHSPLLALPRPARSRAALALLGEFEPMFLACSDGLDLLDALQVG